MKLKPYQKFLLMSAPAIIITVRAWLWIMGFIDYPGDQKMGAGALFSLIDYSVSATICLIL